MFLHVSLFTTTKYVATIELFLFTQKIKLLGIPSEIPPKETPSGYFTHTSHVQ